MSHTPHLAGLVRHGLVHGLSHIYFLLSTHINFRINLQTGWPANDKLHN